jgi:hypothetical protein
MFSLFSGSISTKRSKYLSDFIYCISLYTLIDLVKYQLLHILSQPLHGSKRANAYANPLDITLLNALLLLQENYELSL